METLYLILTALTVGIIVRGFQLKDWFYVVAAFTNYILVTLICLVLELMLQYGVIL